MFDFSVQSYFSYVNKHEARTQSVGESRDNF